MKGEDAFVWQVLAGVYVEKSSNERWNEEEKTTATDLTVIVRRYLFETGYKNVQFEI